MNMIWQQQQDGMIMKNIVYHYNDSNYKCCNPFRVSSNLLVTTEDATISEITLDQLDVIATLGIGGFGRVELVRV